MTSSNRIRSFFGILISGSCIAGIILLNSCASDPPPPPAAPATPTVTETVAPTVPDVDAATAPVAEQAPPAAAEPECQAADDCKKLREPASGLQWSCENARCLEQAIPEAPKADEESAKTQKGSKKGKGKPSTKK